MEISYIMNTEKEWEMLSAIDDEITSGSFDMKAFLNSLTAEEIVAMAKWVNRNGTNKYLPVDGDYSDIVAKSILLEEYIYLNTMEAVGSNIDTVAKMIKLWQFAVDNS